MSLRNINRQGTVEKSNFSTNAQHFGKLGSPSDYVLERGKAPPATPSHLLYTCEMYEKTKELEWPVKKIKKLMRIT